MSVDLDAVRSINSHVRGDGIFHRRVVQLTNAQIKALRATPAELIPAPGAGWWVEVEDVSLIMNYGSNVLSEATANLQVRYKTSNVAIMPAIEMTGFIDQAADQMSIDYAASIVTAPAANIVNRAVELQNNGAAEFGGNAGLDTTMTVIINFQMHKSYL
jgi:hypothetical protein